MKKLTPDIYVPIIEEAHKHKMMTIAHRPTLTEPPPGSVATGKSADFIVLDANPLESILNTRRISAVYLRGEPLDRAALRARWTTPHPP